LTTSSLCEAVPVAPSARWEWSLWRRRFWTTGRLTWRNTLFSWCAPTSHSGAGQTSARSSSRRTETRLSISLLTQNLHLRRSALKSVCVTELEAVLFGTPQRLEAANAGSVLLYGAPPGSTSPNAEPQNSADQGATTKTHNLSKQLAFWFACFMSDLHLMRKTRSRLDVNNLR